MRRDLSWQPVTGAAQRRRGRRLRAALRHEQQSIAVALTESTHHTAPQGQRMARAGGEVRGEARRSSGGTSPPGGRRACTTKSSAGGGPPWVRPPGPEERVQWRPVEQLADFAPMVQILDVLVPQMVGPTGGRPLKLLDAAIPEPFITVPKIPQDSIPRRCGLRAAACGTVGGECRRPQFTSSTREEGDPGTLLGRSWPFGGSSALGHREVYWWKWGTLHTQWNPLGGEPPPAQGAHKYCARLRRFGDGAPSDLGCGRPCDHAAQVPAVLADLQWNGTSDSYHRQTLQLPVMPQRRVCECKT